MRYKRSVIKKQERIKRGRSKKLFASKWKQKIIIEKNTRWKKEKNRERISERGRKRGVCGEK